MASKSKTLYACDHCGAQFPKWQGQCAECGRWNSLQQEQLLASERAAAGARFAGYTGAAAAEVMLLSEVSCELEARLKTGLAEFDLVLGGGLVPDSVVLIGGDPGVGKSTLLLQVLGQLASQAAILYVSGEESAQQIAMRAERLQVDAKAIKLYMETQVERIIAYIKQHKPQVVVVDSIQTLISEQVTAAAGGVSQVRECAGQLVACAKQHHVALFLIGHVTKEGALAGPRVLEHMVDTVLYFEGRGDSRFRAIRAVKNRFGAVNELGVFAMTDRGLRQVSHPSSMFLNRSASAAPGSVVTVIWEGSRPLLVEVQALVDDSHLANPRRVTVGLDANRLAMLLAVLHRHAGVVTFDQDVFVNMVGGLRVHETAVDLALVLAVLSSLRDQALPQDLLVFGEIGLSGEIRPVSSGPERLREAQKHGFRRAIVPLANKPRRAIESMEVMAVESLQQALDMILHQCRQA